jgi:hypothetical protein
LSPLLGWKIKDSEIKAISTKMTMLRPSVYLINNFIRYQHGHLGEKSKMLIGIKRSLFKYGLMFCIGSQSILPDTNHLDRVSVGYRYPFEVEVEVEDVLEKGDVGGGDVSHEHIAALWNEMAKENGLTTVNVAKRSDWSLVNTALKKIPDVKDWEKIISVVPKDRWRVGENDRGWKANFDWLFQYKNGTKTKNYLQLLEDVEKRLAVGLVMEGDYGKEDLVEQN